MNLAAAVVVSVVSLILCSPSRAEAPATKAAEADAQRIDDIEALLDSAVELKDDDAILQTGTLLLENKPDHVDALEAVIEVYIKRKDAAHARKYAQQFVKAWPDKAQSHLSFADACALRLPGESEREASALIAEHLAAARKWSAKPGDFDRQQDLAEAYDKSHQYHLARLEYAQLAASKSTTETERKDALTRADELAEDVDRHAVITVSSLWENEGTLLGLNSDVYAGMWGGWLLGVHSHEDWLYSRQQPKVFGSDQRQDVAVTGRYLISPGWQVDALAGAALTSETSAMGGVVVKKTTASDEVYKVILEANERATDSMQLVRDGGRQDRAAVEAEIPITKQLEIQAMGLARKVDSDLGSVGWGIASNVVVEWRPFKECQDLSLAYEWEYSQFYFDGPFNLSTDRPVRRKFVQPDPEGPLELIREQTNTHMAVVEYKHSFGDLTVNLRMAGGYAFIQHRKEWDPSATISYRLSKDCKLNLIYEYNSADGAQVSSGDAHSLSLAMNVVF